MNRDYLQTLLLKALKEYDPTDSLKNTTKVMADSAFDTSSNAGISLLQLRDLLMLNGKILEEHLDAGYYVASLSFTSFNSALAVICVDNGSVYMIAYAREGLIKQHTAKKNVDALKEKIKKSAQHKN